MSFALLGTATALAALAWVALVASAAVALSWRLRFASARVPSNAAGRARALFRLRTLPAVGALVVAFGLVTPSFLAFEPRVDHETPGGPLLLMALAGGLFLLAGLTRGLMAWRVTRRLARRWAQGAQPLALDGAPAPALLCAHEFPAVALLGVRRPRLFVSRRALELLDPAELQVVLAHESGHLAARDPFRTLLLRACPDPLTLWPLGARLVRAFTRAAEVAADDHATAGDPQRALDLASALVKLGRLAPRMPAAPVTAFEGDGEGLAERIERLLAFAQRGDQPPEPARPARRAGGRASQRVALVSTLLVVLLAGSGDLLRAVHLALEHAVQYLR